MASSLPFVVIALIAITAGSAMVFANDPNNLPTVHTPGQLTQSTSTTNAATGLELRLSLNVTAIASGQTMNVTMSEYNSRAEMNNVTHSDTWPVQELGIGPCGPINYPTGVAIFNGYYTSSNITAAKALTLYTPGIYNCPAIFSVSSYLFYPMNSTAVVYGSCSPGPCFTTSISVSLTFGGYWTGTIPIGALSGGTFQAFPRGHYTVAAGDEWGQLDLLYFVVS